MDKQDLERMIDAGLTRRKISAEAGVSLGSVAYWLNKYGLKTKKGARRSWTDSQLISLCSKNYTYADVLRGLGLHLRPGNYSHIKRHIARLDIDVSHFNRYANAKRTGIACRIPINELMVENCKHSRSVLRRRLIEEGVIEYKCAVCGMEPVWEGKDLTLILDHINGTGNDNRKENLRFVCPNCDVQLSTFCGRGHKGIVNECVDCGAQINSGSTRCRSCAAKLNHPDKIKWPEITVLDGMLADCNGNYEKLGRELGVSGNAIRKHITRELRRK